LAVNWLPVAALAGVFGVERSYLLDREEPALHDRTKERSFKGEDALRFLKHAS
jgi:hypothetical protein